MRLSPDGLNLAGQPQLLFGPVPVGEDYIVNNREDVAEIVLMSGPGLTVWRIDARLPNQQPVDSFAVCFWSILFNNLPFRYQAETCHDITTHLCGLV